MAASHLNHFNEAPPPPAALSGANLRSKQECVIAAGGPQRPPGVRSSGPNNPLSAERTPGRSSDPPQYFTVNSVAVCSLRPFVKTAVRRAPAAWARRSDT
ncbi:hypothetical protein EYF80_051309 [Liparis tanakae]|uniref:Uncharacterized protein n=1 Tax=Liparis tanakae TaxID=230148 RepID=A0A4Z2FBI8_9TELE|nr:hypothetical protein EYF80_051309 [Liparis tanakae]